ncbi:MAG: hypothetical protein JNM80_03575 [Phycisphaerae bacterium]|nr:hypothetical protein [Phycisphaerae bacterium]
MLTTGPFALVSAGYRHGLALRGEADDPDLSYTVVGWGRNTDGETGAWPPEQGGGQTPPYPNAVRLLPVDEKFHKVSAGEHFSAGLVRDPVNPARDRALKMWGTKCIAGTPPAGIYFADDTAHTPTKFVDILAGGHHFIGIIDDGSGVKGYLVSWGYWNYGQPCRMTPGEDGPRGPNVENMALLTQKYVKIVAGHHFDYALREDGVTWDFFGNTEFGVANLPVGTVDIFTGRDHAIGIDANGDLAAWDDPLYPLPDPSLVTLPADERLWAISRGNSNHFHAGRSGCFANRDRSTTAPILSVNDFICFGNEYSSLAALDPNDPAQLLQQIHSRANCDGSTAVPVLTVNDFLCFNNAFAEGCP